MLCFCVNGGPAFIISAVGAGMMGEIRSGVILYCAHIAASLILGLIQRIGVPSSEAQPRRAAGRNSYHAAFLLPPRLSSRSTAPASPC